MIDKNRIYKTRDGREVHIYATDGCHQTIHGAILEKDGWRYVSWYKEGMWAKYPTEHDLIEVKPRIKRTVWLNVYPDKNGDYSQLKNLADAMASENRLACVKVEIDCAEGDGL